MTTKEQECPERNEFTVFNSLNRPTWRRHYTASAQHLLFSLVGSGWHLASVACRVVVLRRSVSRWTVLIHVYGGKKICWLFQDQHEWKRDITWHSQSKKHLETKEQPEVSSMQSFQLMRPILSASSDKYSGSKNGSKRIGKKVQPFQSLSSLFSDVAL